MTNHQFSIEIHASKDTVWETLWDGASFRDWAGNIDEGLYIQGVLKAGNEIQFLSSVNGYGVTSLVEVFDPNGFARFRHGSDTQNNGAVVREKEWTGGTESYTLTEKAGNTTLTVNTDIPEELVEIFNIRLPKALERVKILAETKR